MAPITASRRSIEPRAGGRVAVGPTLPFGQGSGSRAALGVTALEVTAAVHGVTH